MTNLEPLTNHYAFFAGSVSAVTEMLRSELIDADRAVVLLTEASAKLNAERAAFFTAPLETR